MSSLSTIDELLIVFHTDIFPLQPFVDADHLLQQFFLPRLYAVSIPITAGCIVLACLGKLHDIYGGRWKYFPLWDKILLLKIRRMFIFTLEP